jgi:hypothetical protein
MMDVPDPVKLYGSDRIRIPNTVFVRPHISSELLNSFILSVLYLRCWRKIHFLYGSSVPYPLRSVTIGLCVSRFIVVVTDPDSLSSFHQHYYVIKLIYCVHLHFRLLVASRFCFTF